MSIETPDFTIKQGDTGPYIEATLLDATGAVVDLTGATVTFHMAPLNTRVLKVSAPASVITAASGLVRYGVPWLTTETDTDGLYYADFRAEWGDETGVTFPNDGYLVIEIEPSLG